MSKSDLDEPQCSPGGMAAAVQEAVYPLAFSTEECSPAAAIYLNDPTVRRLVEFFERKGLATLKEEDQREQWYADWLAYQRAHQLYARLLSPKQFSQLGSEFDLLRYARFLEVFAYFSPAHGYSLQVTFLGLCALLMGNQAKLKHEAVAALEAGELLAFAISEKGHGADLLGNEFAVAQKSSLHFVANGTKYYIGNANCASIIVVLARHTDEKRTGRAGRAPFVLFALRPERSRGFSAARKIGTLGVRTAFVGEFDVKDYEFPQGDLIAEGRQAWDAVFGAVTLGKFFLGFGSIGICEHALEEAVVHLGGRLLYGKPVIDMPHVRATMVEAYNRLTAMKLYAYRALDYVQAARVTDRRYLLYAAVQKARLSTEGVKVLTLLSECVGAKGFESDTYFEMALRDIQLIPGLEGSTHINLGLTAQFIPRYFARPGEELTDPQFLVTGDMRPAENPYLMEARGTAVHTVLFPHFLKSYAPLLPVANVRLFVKQAKAFQLFVHDRPIDHTSPVAPQTLALGHCLATIAYAQLTAESAVRLSLPAPVVCAVFHSLVSDFSRAALRLASCCKDGEIPATLMRHLVAVPRIADREYEFVSKHMAGTSQPCRWTP